MRITVTALATHTRLAALMLSAAAALTLAGAQEAQTAAQDAPRPNIVYIVADDLGWKDVGFHGSDIRTPTLDALAAEGARLEQYYAQPMCTPTRAAIMTGRYPLRYGLQTGVIPQGHDYGLATDEWLLPQALKEAGYETAIVGKWHLGHADPAYWPRQRGFDHQYGPLIGEIDYFTHKVDDRVDWYRDNEAIVEEGYSTTLLGDDAVKLIEEHDPSVPLFLYLAFNAVHTPYQASQEYLDEYPDIADPSRRAYAASATAMDEQIGRVVAALEAKGMLDDTLVVFQSDNGGVRDAAFAGAITDMSKVVLPADNGPYREGKATLYEGGTRVVAFASWPGHIEEGSTVNEMIHTVDLFPTLGGAGGRRSRQEQAPGRARRLGDDQRGQALAAHRGRLQHRAAARRHSRGRLEARLEHDAPAVDRALQHRGGPVGDEEPRRGPSRQSGRAAEARRRTGCRGAGADPAPDRDQEDARRPAHAAVAAADSRQSQCRIAAGTQRTPSHLPACGGSPRRYRTRPTSTQFATISPGTASCARSASRAKSSRFGSFTCGTSRKIGAVT
jgi:arylsulfatase A-like enzyme